MKILYISSVNWNWIKQRPHFICEGLAKYGYSVDYFSMTPFGKQKIKKVDLNLQNLTVKDIYSIPLGSRCNLIRYLNKRIVDKVLDLEDYDVIFFTHPLQTTFFERSMLEKLPIIYDCMDNISAFYIGEIKKRVLELEQELCKVSRRIIASSCTLKKRMVQRYNLDENKVEVIRNAVDESFFSEDSYGESKRLTLRKPCMMYVGTIEDWLDFDLLNKLLRENPTWTLYMVGPYRRKMKDRIVYRERCIWLGKKDHKEIPALIEAADLMVIPFKKTELIECVDPVKMYEFIAMGKNILSTYWDELDYFKDYKDLYFMSDVSGLNLDLKKEFCQWSTYKAKEFQNNNVWNNRIGEYNTLIITVRR